MDPLLLHALMPLAAGADVADLDATGVYVWRYLSVTAAFAVAR